MDAAQLKRDSLVILPTYNEAENLTALVPRILEQGSFDVLIVDDNSPDGTGTIADDLANQFPGRVVVHHRPEKLGLASAYLQGFSYALETRYSYIFEMDADFSHRPDTLPALRERLFQADVVLGSRYTPGGGTQHWSLFRQMMSRGGSGYARMVLGLPFQDVTGGFKGFRRQVLEQIRPASLHARGFGFQIELTYRCYQHGFQIVEYPILFEERRAGYSKMNWRIFTEAVWLVWKLRLGNVQPKEAHI
jgi:dolichol-phosphate mannosyltransferase